jgi:hypothetical protein
MNLNDRVEKLLAKTRELLPTEEEEREILEEQERFRVWWETLCETLIKMCESLPEELKELFERRTKARIEQMMEAWENGGESDWQQDGLFRWINMTLGDKEAPPCRAVNRSPRWSRHTSMIPMRCPATNAASAV